MVPSVLRPLLFATLSKLQLYIQWLTQSLQALPPTLAANSAAAKAKGSAAPLPPTPASRLMQLIGQEMMGRVFDRVRVHLVR